jgi:hypothetical protein
VPARRGGNIGRSPSSPFCPRGPRLGADPFLGKVDAPAEAIDRLGGGTEGGAADFIEAIDDLRESDAPSPVT